MQAMREHSSSVWEYVALAAERGDERTVQKYEAELFGDDKFSNRGSRNSPRFKNYYRGYLALKFGRVDEAIGHFQRTLQHAPATWDIDPFEDCLGRAYLELGRNDEAIAEFQRVLRLNPRYPLANYHLGRAFLARGMTSEAMNSFQVFLSDVRDADAWAAETNDARRLLGQS
jgi:tetratricopeptide (TPR) repeat protein